MMATAKAAAANIVRVCVKGLENCAYPHFLLFKRRSYGIGDAPKPHRVALESENLIQRGYSSRSYIDSLRESFSKFRSNGSWESRTASLGPGRCSCNCAARSQACDLGRESAAPEAVCLRRRSQILHRSRLRLFGNCFLRAGRGRFAKIANQLDGIS